MLYGFHVQNSPNNYLDAVRELAPRSLVKFTSGWERAMEVKQANPDVKIWVRHVVEQPMPTSNYEQTAIDYFKGMVDVHAPLWHSVDYIQGWNEFYAESQTWDEKRHWVAMDIAFAKIWQQEYQPLFPHIRFIMSEAAIGNSIPWQAAEGSVRYGAILGYHNYTPVLNKQISPVDEWPFLSGRWKTMDNVYRDKGIFVDWAFGEGGPYQSAITGWRHKVVLDRDMEAYKRILLYGIDKIRDTLAWKQGRVLGGVLFTCGAPGGGPNWSWFDHNTDEMKEIAIFVKGVMNEEPLPPDKPPEPPIEPPTKECRGEPREQYKRVYLALPQHATRDEWQAVCDAAYAEKRTVGFSYDDSAVGDLDSRRVICYGLTSYQQGEYTDWYASNYPGVRVEYRDYPELQYEFRLENRPCVTTRITQYFGENKEYYYKTFGLYCGHNGLDFATPLGEEIRATSDGWIKFAGNDPGGYGLHVRIDHNPALSDPDAAAQQWLTLYAHLNSFMPWVEDGAWVSANTVIGYADSTGVSTGNHLHFEIRHDNVAVDPLPYIDAI